MPLDQQVGRFGEVQIDFANLSVRGPAGEHRLRLKPFQVLSFLIERRERVVTKDELFAHLWPGVTVTEDTLTQCITDLRRALGDDARDPRYIRTAPKIGYQFIAEAVGESAENAVRGRPMRRWMLPAMGLALAAAAIAAFVPNLGTEEAARRTIAIMPFVNGSHSADFEWLSEGVPDMLITALGQSDAVSVLGRQQLHQLLQRREGGATLETALAVAREARADAVVTGTYYAVGDSIRIDARVYDGASGKALGSRSLRVDAAESVLREADGFAQKIAAVAGVKTEPAPQPLAIATNDLKAYRLYSLAVEHANSLRNREAIELLEQAIERDPAFAMAHARIGYAYAVTWNLPEQARPHLEKAYALADRLTPKDRLSIEAWYSIANLDYGRAIAAYRKLIAQEPLEVEAYWRAGNLLRGEERLDEAAEVLRRGLTVDAESADLHLALSGVLADQEKHAEAIEAARKATELTPGEANAFDNLGIVEQWAGKVAEAESAYGKAMQLDPASERPHVHMGNLHFQAGRFAQAIAEYERYIALAPSDLERGRGYGRIAWVYWKQGDYARAEAAARRERSLEPTAVFNSILLALRRGDRKSAERWMPQIDHYSNTSRGARTSRRYEEFFRGMFALETGANEEALAHFRRALEHRPAIWSMDAYEDCLADALLKLGRLPEAITEYRRVLARHPHLEATRLHLAGALERAN